MRSAAVVRSMNDHPDESLSGLLASVANSCKAPPIRRCYSRSVLLAEALGSFPNAPATFLDAGIDRSG